MPIPKSSETGSDPGGQAKITFDVKMGKPVAPKVDIELLVRVENCTTWLSGANGGRLKLKWTRAGQSEEVELLSVSLPAPTTSSDEGVFVFSLNKQYATVRGKPPAFAVELREGRRLLSRLEASADEILKR